MHACIHTYIHTYIRLLIRTYVSIIAEAVSPTSIVRFTSLMSITHLQLLQWKVGHIVIVLLTNQSRKLIHNRMRLFARTVKIRMNSQRTSFSSVVAHVIVTYHFISNVHILSSEPQKLRKFSPTKFKPIHTYTRVDCTRAPHAPHTHTTHHPQRPGVSLRCAD